MHRKFASLQHPEQYGYAYDSEAFDSNAEVDWHMRMFHTYGDGLCQHSGDWPIATQFMPDYLASLAKAMLEDTELVERSTFDFCRVPTNKTIAFCASVKWKESDREWGKRRYYSVSELKISNSRSKEHDKRYQEIREWNDGTPEAIYRMCIPDYSRALQMYSTAQAIREWCSEESGRGWMELPAIFLKWFDLDTRIAQDMHYAFNACKLLCQAHSLRGQAQCHLNNVSKPKVEEEAASDAA